MESAGRSRRVGRRPRRCGRRRSFMQQESELGTGGRRTHTWRASRFGAVKKTLGDAMVLAAASGAYARQGRRDAYQIVELRIGNRRVLRHDTHCHHMTRTPSRDGDDGFLLHVRPYHTQTGHRPALAGGTVASPDDMKHRPGTKSIAPRLDSRKLSAPTASGSGPANRLLHAAMIWTARDPHA